MLTGPKTNNQKRKEKEKIIDHWAWFDFEAHEGYPIKSH